MAGELSNVAIQFAVAGAQQAAQQSDQVGKSIASVGVSAQQASAQAASAGTSFASLATRLIGVGTAVKAVNFAFSEFAEDERAQVALTKMGVAAQDLARAGSLVEKIQWITGDKVSAAEMLGRVLNGNTRGLKQFGIEVEEGASKTDLWAAAQQLAARGTAVMTAESQTATGAMKILSEEVGNFASEFLGSISLDVLPAWQELMIAFGDTQPVGDAYAAQQNLEKQAKAAAVAMQTEKNASAALKVSLGELKTQMDATAFAHEEMRKEIERGAQQDAAAGDADLKEQLATIDELQAKGTVDDKTAGQMKAKAQAQADVRSKERDKATADSLLAEEKRNRASMAEDLQTASRSRERAAGAPEEERQKLDKKIEELNSKIQEADARIKEFEAQSKIAEQELRGAKAGVRSQEAQERTQANEDRKKADDQKQKDIDAAAKTVRSQQDKAAKEGGERSEAFGDFAGNLEKAADLAPSPRQREAIRARARRLRGGGSDQEIDEAQKEVSGFLGRRARSRTGNRGEEAQELQSQLKQSGAKAKEANDAGTEQLGQEAQNAAAALQSMSQQLGPAMQAMLAAAQSAEATLKQTEAKAKQGQRMAGRGGG